MPISFMVLALVLPVTASLSCQAHEILRLQGSALLGRSLAGCYVPIVDLVSLQSVRKQFNVDCCF